MIGEKLFIGGLQFRISRGSLHVEVVYRDARSRSRTPTRCPLKEHYGKTWTRKFSPTRGDFLRVEDEVNMDYTMGFAVTLCRCQSPVDHHG